MRFQGKRINTTFLHVTVVFLEQTESTLRHKRTAWSIYYQHKRTNTLTHSSNFCGPPITFNQHNLYDSILN